MSGLIDSCETNIGIQEIKASLLSSELKKPFNSEFLTLPINMRLLNL